MAENAGRLLMPRNPAARATTSRPQLPRRRAQEHLAPQLRGGPLPRPEQDALVIHDPGLMAAFRRGIGLAEQHQTEGGRSERSDAETGRAHALRVDAEQFEPHHARAPGAEFGHRDATGATPQHPDGSPSPAHTLQSAHTDTPHPGR